MRHVKVSCLDANVTVGWQRTKNEQRCDEKTHRKAKFWNFWMKTTPSKVWRRKKKSWFAAHVAQEFGCFLGLTETLSTLATCPLTLSIPILSFNHSSVRIIWFRSSLTQTYCRSPSSYSIYAVLPKARPWAEDWSFFRVFKNMIFTKPETESDEVHVSPYLIFLQAWRETNVCTQTA